MKALVIFIPSLVGFTAAFHFFLHGNEHFHDFLRSFLKVIVMMLGELDFADHFLYSEVNGLGGRNVFSGTFFDINGFIVYNNHASIYF